MNIENILNLAHRQQQKTTGHEQSWPLLLMYYALYLASLVNELMCDN
jgi:hypothetical protein